MIKIIAEIGLIHEGSIGNAKKLVELAKHCGATIVKFQTHLPKHETLPNAPEPPYFKDEKRFEYFTRTSFDLPQWQIIKNHCHSNDIQFMSSPFSNAAVELLEKLNVTSYKIPSGEITNIPMLKLIAETGKPTIISSGMSTWEELDEAVNVFLKKHSNLTVMQCTSEYPCHYENIGLNILNQIKERYKLPFGLSDHSLTPYASFAAVTLGATVIEKHLTFHRGMYGSDPKHSMEPYEFKVLCEGINAITAMLNSNVDKMEQARKLQIMKDIFEKSIVSIADIPKGTILSSENIGVKKPGIGIKAKFFDDFIGKRTNKNIANNSFLTYKDIEHENNL